MGIGRFITHTMFGKGVSDYGAVSVPGSSQFELPAGKVTLTYQESRRSKNVGVDNLADIQFSVPAQLEISVTPASGGAPLAIDGPGLMGAGQNTSTKKGQSRDQIGSVEITDAGTYTVTVGPDLPDAVDPQLLIGS